MEHENMVVVQKTQHITSMRDSIDTDAFFSDGTEFYRNPPEPKAGRKVDIRFRTKKDDVEKVYLVSGKNRWKMQVVQSRNGFDFYGVKFKLPKGIFRYHFEIIDGITTYYYNCQGVTKEPQVWMDFEIYPGYETPDWAKGAVMYQIFVDRFYNGDPKNDVVTCEYFYIGDVSVKVDDWFKAPAAMGVREFYGGDLQGVMDKLDYLQDLGVEVIYLNPIFVSPSNHKYDCQDYDYVDPHYGVILEDADEILWHGDHINSHAKKFIKRVTDKKNLEASNALFAKLVEEIHRRGMKIILDGVFNHCGSFNKWMDREQIYSGQDGYEDGAYVSADSPYRDFFKFSDYNQWPYNGSYDGWWGHDTLPKLNYEGSKELYNYILEVGKKWVSPPYNVDGWRLDVAADLGHSSEFNHKFWKDFRKTVKKANPNASILAEHYGSAENWLQGDEWDTVMNYDAFMEPLTWFLTGMEKHSDEYRDDMFGNSDAFISAMKVHMRRLHMSALQTAMNELSNHDHSRFLTRTNHRPGRIAYAGAEAASKDVNVAVMREAVAVQMTWPGAPTLYYGDEAGLCGFTDPDNRRAYPWGRENKELIEFHKKMIAIHKKYRVLKNGSVEFLWNDYQGLSYARFTNDERIIVIINNRNEERKAVVPVWKAGVDKEKEAVMQRLMLTYKEGFTDDVLEYVAKNGLLKIHMAPYSVNVLYHKD